MSMLGYVGNVGVNGELRKNLVDIYCSRGRCILGIMIKTMVRDTCGWVKGGSVGGVGDG